MNIPALSSCWCCVCVDRKSYGLSQAEEDALKVIKKLLLEPKEGNEVILKELLGRYWSAVYSSESVPESNSPEWKRLGFQSSNPTTDVRTGLFPMRQLLYLAEKYPVETQSMIKDSRDKNSEYPFSACCFNASYMVTRYLGFHENPGVDPVGENLQVTPKKLKCLASILKTAGASAGALPPSEEQTTTDSTEPSDERNRQSQVIEKFNELFCATMFRVNESWMKLEERNLLKFRSPMREALHAVINCLGDRGHFDQISDSFSSASRKRQNP